VGENYTKSFFALSTNEFMRVYQPHWNAQQTQHLENRETAMLTRIFALALFALLTTAAANAAAIATETERALPRSGFVQSATLACLRRSVALLGGRDGCLT
jgi:hypothetical protein